MGCIVVLSLILLLSIDLNEIDPSRSRLRCCELIKCTVILCGAKMVLTCSQSWSLNCVPISREMDVNMSSLMETLFRNGSLINPALSPAIPLLPTSRSCAEKSEAPKWPVNELTCWQSNLTFEHCYKRKTILPMHVFHRFEFFWE